MCEKTSQAILVYEQARRAEQDGNVKLAEARYLQSHTLFEEACRTGGTDCLDAAKSLNAITFLRWSRRDYEGALRSARESVTILETSGTQFINPDAGFIYDTSCNLMIQMQYELALVSTQ